MADRVGMTERNVCSVVSTETCAANRDPVAPAFAPCQIENIVRDDVFIRIVSPHPIGRVN